MTSSCDNHGVSSRAQTNNGCRIVPSGFLLTAISTLYEDAGAAERSLREFACGLPIEANVQLEPLLVPELGDGASGFLVRQFEENAPTFVDTTVCFRTGRVVHAIQATSVAGVEDIGFVIRLAERMLARTDAAFAKAEG